MRVDDRRFRLRIPRTRLTLPDWYYAHSLIDEDLTKMAIRAEHATAVMESTYVVDSYGYQIPVHYWSVFVGGVMRRQFTERAELEAWLTAHHMAVPKIKVGGA